MGLDNEVLPTIATAETHDETGSLPKGGHGKHSKAGKKKKRKVPSDDETPMRYPMYLSDRPATSRRDKHEHKGRKIHSFKSMDDVNLLIKMENLVVEKAFSPWTNLISQLAYESQKAKEVSETYGRGNESCWVFL
eukprot:Selendium_serpulae@DN11348_c0_g1_i1.p3